MLNIISGIISNSGKIDVKGTLTGTYTENTFLYSSSIDSIANLYAKYSYDSGLTNMPILILMHSWTANANEFTQVMMQKFASYKYFAVSVGMRARNGASGSRDASARELHDVKDAVTYVLNNFSSLVNPKKIHFAGWSGGGGTSLGLCAKFPDLFGMTVDNFGMSDYGYDPTESWRVTNPTYATQIIADIGAISETNEYLSRVHVNSIGNYVGKLFMFHDLSDSFVNVINSQNIRDKLIDLGKQNYKYYQSQSGDSDRWTHGIPSIGSDIEAAEQYWKDEGLKLTNKSIKSSGTFYISGYLITKRFEIWLGNGTVSLDGTNRNATLVYDIANDSYTVTPILEGSATDVEVKITQFGSPNKTATQTISTETEIIVT